MAYVKRFPFVTGMLIITALLAYEGKAFINPRFTPVHLVDESGSIVKVELLEPGGSIFGMRAVKALKGAAWAGDAELDLSQIPPEVRKHLERAFRTSERTALIFVSDAEGASEAQGQSALILAGTTWARIHSSDGRRWTVDKIDAQMSGTWAGSGEMLGRAVECILSDPAVEIPVSFEGKWGKPVKIGKFDGKMHGLLPRHEQGKQGIIMLSESGDHVFDWDRNSASFKDMTAPAHLKSTSHTAVLTDLNHDGRPDLVSWDGRSVSVWLSSSQGVFTKLPAEFKIDNCFGLTTIPREAPGEQAILVSGEDSFIVLKPDDSGNLLADTAFRKTQSSKVAGKPGAMLVGDFTNDNIPDVLEPYPNGLFLYAGQVSGLFGDATIVGSARSLGTCSATFCGDYDADGRLDVVVGGSSGIALWHNQGAGRFCEVLEETGELAYISKPGAIGGSTCDFNNDGRQDLMIAYEGMAPQFFFNRGFRTFGFASSFGPPPVEGFPNVSGGCQAALVTDVNGNGEQDLLLVTQDQELWALLDRKSHSPNLALSVSLESSSRGAAPILLTAWKDKRCLGSYNLSPGNPDAFYGIESPGPIKLRWQLQNRRAIEKEILVNGATKAVITAEEIAIETDSAPQLNVTRHD